MVAYVSYKVIYISRRWRDLTEMFRNTSASASNSFCVYFFRWPTMRPMFSRCCRYRHWAHRQPAGLIRLTGHLMLLAFFPGPLPPPETWGAKVFGPHCSTGAEITSQRGRMEEKCLWGIFFFIFKARRYLCQSIRFYSLVILSCWEACLLLYTRSRAVFWLCQCRCTLHNEDDTLHSRWLQSEGSWWDGTL